MRLFGKKKNKKHNTIQKGQKTLPNQSAVTKTERRPSLTSWKFIRQDSVEPVMEQLPAFILDLEHEVKTSSRKAAKALRGLFALSEHADTDNRRQMVREENGSLVPVLLKFLSRCAPKSSEQYLALLVLNNISIPSENKKIIASDHAGVGVLARLLCNDPSCHLMAIILVNLTFADVGLRKLLVSEQAGHGLVESLAYALRVASLTPEEYEARRSFIEETTVDTPAHRLALLMAEDQSLRPVKKKTRFREIEIETLDPSSQLYPETARWCLAALKNLTRPCKDATAAHILIKSGVFSLILRYITLSGGYEIHSRRNSIQVEESRESGSSSSHSPTPCDPISFPNSPSTWNINSVQDSALFIVLNLSACPSSRDYVYENDAVNILSSITELQSFRFDDRCGLTKDERSQQELQCMKARMALAYMLGSEGHFGQAKITSSTSTVDANSLDYPLVISEVEVALLVELVANSLHERGKDGCGGYSAATFGIKYVLFAMRCLLTHTFNQTLVAELAGRKVCTLFLKILALHSLEHESGIDAEDAEHVCFSLYLLSNYGFKQPFLPSLFTSEDENDGICLKVITSYLQSSTVTPAGRHAAEQLLLRLKYLNFEGTIADLVQTTGSFPCISDLSFEGDLLVKVQQVAVGERKHGAKPTNHIFDRPILRSRKPTKQNARSPWDNRAKISVFPTALQAVQQLSYGSLKVRHTVAIDEILIANNIGYSADGERTESYNFWWSWEDTANEIHLNLERQRSTESFFSGISSRQASFDTRETRSILGPLCGACVHDNTVG